MKAGSRPPLWRETIAAMAATLHTPVTEFLTMPAGEVFAWQTAAMTIMRPE